MMASNKDKMWLSHSGLDVLYRCPRCFWLKYNQKIFQPEGVVSRLPDRFDKVIKNYFNPFRVAGELPPMIEGKIEGRLQNPFKEAYFYGVNDKYGFYAKLDECLVDNQGRHIPIDFKTSSSDPRNREVFPAYQNQMDEFVFLLEQNNRPTAGIGYLLYFYPQETLNLHDGLEMLVHLQKLETHPENVRPRLLEATAILEKPLPEPAANCAFCQWRENVNNVLKSG